MHMHLRDNNLFFNESTLRGFSILHRPIFRPLCEFHCTSLWNIFWGTFFSSTGKTFSSFALKNTKNKLFSFVSVDMSSGSRFVDGRTHSFFRFHCAWKRCSLDVQMDIWLNLSQTRFLWRLKSYFRFRSRKTRLSWNLLPFPKSEKVFRADWCKR